MRVLTEHTGRGIALQVARPVADEDAALHRLRFALTMLGLSALFLSVVLGGWIAQTALAPVRRLTRAAEAVAATQSLALRLDEKREGRGRTTRRRVQPDARRARALARRAAPPRRR